MTRIPLRGLCVCGRRLKAHRDGRLQLSCDQLAARRRGPLGLRAALLATLERKARLCPRTPLNR